MVDDSRQAGASFLTSSEDASGFVLNYRSNSVYIGHCSAEKSACGHFSSTKEAVQSYLDGGVYVHIETRLGRHACEVETTAGGSPVTQSGDRKRSASCSYSKSSSAGVGERDNPVCVVVPKVVQGPERAVPSFVCCFLEHKVDYVLMHILAAASIDVIDQSGFFVGGKKLRPFWFPPQDGGSARVNCMVKGVSQIARGGADEHTDFSGYGLDELHIEQMLSSFWVLIDATGPVLMAEEGFYEFFDSGDVFFRFLN